ncbi:hypothetical protein B4U80_11500 [Leptotrombidium deliense]|uniref:Mitochondrial fission process protein 1 n=1 Tax=Leptotrombidium deliense TaxID=299467 RepID=A0A443SMK5_9ACAR|nr:hypothetical protein B4U80_11500 [Leptotrombidium deliense]
MTFELKGYANEIGEAFRPLVHRNVVRLSYVVAFGYCTADATHKAINVNEKTSHSTYQWKRSFQCGMDALIWQVLASVIIPGFTINRICWATLTILRKFNRIPTSTAKWSAAFVSIASIPLIVKPIDNFVDKLLDNSIRQLYNQNDK